jgi:hypothetical protein
MKVLSDYVDSVLSASLRSSKKFSRPVFFWPLFPGLMRSNAFFPDLS